jgi:hypothetical protein
MKNGKRAVFRILKRSFQNLDYAQGGKQISYGDVITYYDAELAGGGVWFTIPLRYRSDFHLSLLKINGAVPPHTDSEVKTSINFYIEPGNYVTTFYTPEPKAVKRQIENQTNGYIFSQDELANRGSFVAKPGDAYLLGIDHVHDVQGSGERTLLCLGTDKHGFYDVLHMLVETGNV